MCQLWQTCNTCEPDCTFCCCTCALVCPWCVPSFGDQHWFLPLCEFSFPAFPLPAIHHLPCQPMCILIACLLCLLMLVSTFLAEYLAASGTPYRLACVSIQVAWLHCGSATTLRSWSCIAAHTGALHPRCSYCCTLLCCGNIVIFHSFSFVRMCTLSLFPHSHYAYGYG